ncbi:hypothetical protein ckin111_02910 [Helicobacter pylori]
MDYISVDEKGNVIPGTLTQSKFVGRNGEECFKKLLSKDYEKYFENGTKMKIARNHYGDFQRAVNTRIKSLESQIAKQKGLGDIQKAAYLEEKLQHCKTIKAHTRPASATKGEAIEPKAFHCQRCCQHFASSRNERRTNWCVDRWWGLTRNECL